MVYKHIPALDAESVYEISGKQSRIIKKHHDQQIQITLYELSEDRILYVEPVDGEGSYKTYYVQSGKCLILETNAEMSSGDFLICNGSEEVLTLKTLEPTVIIVHAAAYDTYKTIQDSQDKITMLLKSIQEKDHYTGEHSLRVYELVKKLGMQLGYKAIRLNNLTKAAYYHDLGKIFVEDEILNKPDRLSDEEFEAIKLHATLSESLIKTHFNADVYDIISQHHERWNGKGYPKGLSGLNIREEARIIAVCDSYDAMITDRVYKKGKTEEQALQELIELSGILYDKRLVDAFVKMILS
ncbi:HD-GYP domain-containing protein [Fusibacter tunisiensis]|uniref:HD-GYP domain-containing protein (C-di-GMP phosphodiesterase class II) n=1 Tax=Fusibacter tunisiensis TaxID=1008308 RepID=A0ABS2MNF7_9FIRM|nr:HD-GYP domain-containing protein [Fusibacter tunisiensis]MBM7560941.1 HD-GYP domain-containing protein (c-di-GMP phosphodiesterase class II) [Fusibacter tunisiensis]